MEPSTPEGIWAEQLELWSDEGFNVDFIIGKLNDEASDNSTSFLEVKNQIKKGIALNLEDN